MEFVANDNCQDSSFQAWVATRQCVPIWLYVTDVYLVRYVESSMHLQG